LGNARRQRPYSAPALRCRPTAAELDRLQQLHARDLALAARRSVASQQQRDQATAKSRRLHQLREAGQQRASARAAHRDPSRLLRPTAATEARAAAEAAPPGLFAERPVHVPRITPLWMGK
jgi:hypothetical protein